MAQCLHGRDNDFTLETRIRPRQRDALARQRLGPNWRANECERLFIALDSLCYREWGDVARVTAHEVARYMGLYDNVEIDPSQTDPIGDSDTSSTNLMFYSELGGISLSSGQREILTRSPVLR